MLSPGKIPAANLNKTMVNNIPALVKDFKQIKIFMIILVLLIQNLIKEKTVQFIQI